MGTLFSSLLLVCVTAETINKDTANTVSKSQLKCNDSTCNINCIADRSCTSSFSDDISIPFQIHCPPQRICNECNINCYGEYSCQNTLIYVHNCSSINIMATKSYSMNGTIIITDTGSTDYDYTGYLSIANNETYLLSDNSTKTHIMSYLTINNENIANITINCYGDSIYSQNECNNLEILQNVHSTDISLNCHSNTNCSATSLYCPIDAVSYPNDENNYHSNCNLTCNHFSDCHDISIYAEHGIPADFWIICDDNNNNSCIGSNVFCGKQYKSQCIMTYNDSKNEWFCHDIDDGQSCINITWIYQIHNPTVKISSFWTQTYYGIPMTILAGVIILCLIIVITKILKKKATDTTRNMMRYEMEDAQELEQENIHKKWLKNISQKILKNTYGPILNADDLDDEETRKRIEMQNLSKMTRSDEVDHDSDDDIDLDGIHGTGGDHNNDTIGYSYGHTFAVHDL